jgi:pimeloyl-ACP methyl ester carboxylesterase
VRGIELAYDDEGAGLPVVLLHGYPFNRSMWREQVEALAPGYRVIAPDLRGHGQTEPTADEPATMQEMALDVAALLDELGLKRVTLCGLSMGGYVALAFHQKFPLRVRSLVLADTRAGADTEDARRGREEQALKVLKEGMRSIADGFIQKVLTPETINTRPEIVTRVRRMITGTNPQGAANALRGMALRRDYTESLPGIVSPTLIIVGSRDKITPPEEAGLLHREIRGSRLEVITGAAHLSNLERPAEFNRALKLFLDAQQP